MTLDPFKIRLDGGTQPRTYIDYSLVDEYAEDMKAGDAFPPVVVFFDGADYWLADGFHRVHAAKAAGIEVAADVRQGSKQDAIWFSCAANIGHGLRRRNTDKHRAVEAALRLLAGGYKVPGLDADSTRGVANHCGVGNALVHEIKKQVFEKNTCDAKPAKSRVTGRDGKSYPATRKVPKRKLAPEPERDDDEVDDPPVPSPAPTRVYQTVELPEPLPGDEVAAAVRRGLEVLKPVVADLTTGQFDEWVVSITPLLASLR